MHPTTKVLVLSTAKKYQYRYCIWKVSPILLVAIPILDINNPVDQVECSHPGNLLQRSDVDLGYLVHIFLHIYTSQVPKQWETPWLHGRGQRLFSYAVDIGSSDKIMPSNIEDPSAGITGPVHQFAAHQLSRLSSRTAQSVVCMHRTGGIWSGSQCVISVDDDQDAAKQFG